IAHFAGFEDATRTIVLSSGGNGHVDLALQLSGVREQVTVTATGGKQASFDALQPTLTVGSNRIIERGSVGLGDAVNNQPGVTMRSATPLSTRPVIRGFDGDRILVARDGIRNGSVSALSENEAEPVDLQSLDRIEIVRGPSTLLYGSNAIGGVVNTISRYGDEFQPGLNGYVTVTGGSNNRQASASGGLNYGFRNWMVWGNGSGLRTSDQHAGGNFGLVENTFARTGNGSGGFGYFSKKAFFTANYNYYRNRYGIPIEPEDPEERMATIAARHHDFRFNGGFRDLDSFIEEIKFTFDYSRYTHRESEIFDRDPSTERFSEFHNQLYAYRAVLSQRRHGKLSGTFGFDGYHRKFFVVGEETLLPGIVNQTQSSGFILEQVNLERITFQFGGRVENSRYRPTDSSLINRTLTGFSGAAGARFALWNNGAFVANYSHAERLPDLEELYDDGPHDDTLSFEMGNPHLRKEISDGVDFSLRHQTKRVRAEANFFYYNIRNFVYLLPTGEEDEDTGLEVTEYEQADSHFSGFEANFDYDANSYLTLLGGIDYVRAQFRSGINLPRIPPFRGRVGFEAHYKGAHVRPELILVHNQERVFTDETTTPGYGVFNIVGGYTWMARRFANTISVNAFNLANKYYINHVSFIKDFSPEIGRGIRASYTIRFF
ncbi:MAG: TonB-dependent receptor, partial [Pyrinomonadaceae bacterium]